MSRSLRQGALALVLLLIGGCSAGRLAGAGAADVDLDSVPFYPQTLHHCGPAALAEVLGASGVAVAPDALAADVYVPGLEGSLQAELMAATRRRGRIAYPLSPSLPALYAELDAGRPVLVLQNFGLETAPAWHYAVAVGYERGGRRILLRTGTTRRDAVAERRFDATWRRAGRWAFVVVAPAEIPASAEPAPWLQAAGELAATDGRAVAMPAYEAAVRRWPQEPLAWIALGNARLADGAAAEAEAAFAAAVRVRPTSVAARNNYALLLSQRGCREAALREIKRAARDAADTSLATDVEDSAHQIATAAPRPSPAQACPAPDAPP